MKHLNLILFFFFVACLHVFAQTDTVRSYTTAFVQGTPPHIDGQADDPAWEQVPWSSEDFIQLEPDAGKIASVQTRFKILYDARNLYVLVLNLDPEPDKIMKRMSRRDGFEGDFVEINIDSYYDKRTAFSFTASVSGVKGDEYVSNNGNNWDASWDPIWYLQTSIVEEGWIAEFRIPLSQLRFADKPEHVWGLQFTRRFFRNQERSNWQYIRPDAGGWVHLFGDLKGIKGIKPQKQLEIQPYVLAKTERFQKEEGNPFMTGKSSAVDFGLDAKIGITSDITLDLTVNPDFGQVEADPSQVNLSAFRLFFQERRPFFIEGSNTLHFPILDFNQNNLFYSRRIGRSPQGSVDTDESGEDDVDEYVKQPANTTILGAIKLTGKNKNGFSWGLLESITAPERAEIDSLGHRSHQVIEPFTNYLVARVQQDIHKGNTIVGGMFTSTNRNIKDSNLDWLHRNAYSGGFDLVHHWKQRKYYVSLKTMMSRVDGKAESITQTQQASERYFQRPDNHHAKVDSLRNTLTGTGGTVIVGKKAGKLVFDVGYNWMSPELELNDIGFLTQTDVMSQWTWMQYRILKPFGITRWMRYSANQWNDLDFDGRILSRGYELNESIQFKNFWIVETGVGYTARNVSNADLRGGPALHYPRSFNSWMWISSDSRKKLQASFSPNINVGHQGYMRNTGLNLTINYKPINALSISLAPSFSRNKNETQYVTTAETSSVDKHIVAKINQTTARVSLRMTYMITPNLSVQYWGQPFGTTGKYTDFKYVTDADAERYNSRYTKLPTSWLTLSDDVYSVDEDEDGTADYTFDKPDFNIGQFRSNMVVRWEYIPGSVLFLVWTQEMNGDFYERSGSLADKYAFNFSDKAHNIFLIKYTYRFVL